jgi:hypothetical protein
MKMRNKNTCDSELIHLCNDTFFPPKYALWRQIKRSKRHIYGGCAFLCANELGPPSLRNENSIPMLVKKNAINSKHKTIVEYYMYHIVISKHVLFSFFMYMFKTIQHKTKTLFPWLCPKWRKNKDDPDLQDLFTINFNTNISFHWMRCSLSSIGTFLPWHSLFF